MPTRPELQAVSLALRLRVTAGARGYLCDADPGVFSRVPISRIRRYRC
jgi:hypothetical protein